jgi:hypothetical protein
MTGGFFFIGSFDCRRINCIKITLGPLNRLTFQGVLPKPLLLNDRSQYVVKVRGVK